MLELFHLKKRSVLLHAYPFVVMFEINPNPDKSKHPYLTKSFFRFQGH